MAAVTICSDFESPQNRLGCYFLLQGIFLTQGSNLHLLYHRLILYHWATREVPWHYFTPGYNKVFSLMLVQFSHSVMCNSLWPHALQHTRLPYPSPTPGACSNSCPLSQWCHQTISSSVIPFSSCLQTFPASGTFPMSQFFTSGGQSTGTSDSASVLPMKTQDWFPSGLTGLVSLQSKGLSRFFSNTTAQKHQFFGAHLSLLSNSHIHTWLLEKP